MKSVTVTLAEPIEVHGNTVSELTLNRPKGRELREMPIKQNVVMGDLYAVAAACADVPPSTIDQLDAIDLIRVIEVVGGFLGVGTGAKRSS